MEFWYWESVVYSIVVWMAVFVFLDIERIKALWPIGLLSSVLLLTSHFFLSSLGSAHFNEGFLTLAGVPLFHLFWSFGAGLLLIGFMPREFIKKILTLLLFTILALALDMLSVRVGGHVHDNFTFLHSFVFILYRLVTLVWIAEELLGEKMYAKGNRKETDYRLRNLLKL
ncbi:MAG: hypothetical protein PHO01_04775 [Desulfotomaculaceae bacterium]|nr:hypothetical protein [Desulfotomaculaceae bacterium]